MRRRTVNRAIALVASTAFLYGSRATARAQALDEATPSSRFTPSHTLTPSIPPTFTMTRTPTPTPTPFVVSGVTPSSGSAAGGTPVVVVGQNFRADSTLTFGGAGAIDVAFVGPTEIDATTPPLLAGSLNDVAVTGPGGPGHLAAPVAVLPGGWLSDYLDVPQADIFHAAVEKLTRYGVTAGCGGGSYCRDAPVRRDQMAVFLLKAEHGPGFVPGVCSDTFLDVPCSSPFAPWIESLWLEGITGGCGGENYCPAASVTRAQMAVFLLKTAHGWSFVPPACTGFFADVPCAPDPAFAVDWIEELFVEGITGGCSSSPLKFCPNSPVPRGQMAAFLVKAFGLP